MYASKLLAPYEYWINDNQKFFTLQNKFLRLSAFDTHTHSSPRLHTDDSNPNFQSVNQKRVHQETYKRFWDTLPPNFTEKIVFQKKCLPLHFRYI